MAVDRCICHDVPFTRIAALRAAGCTFEEVREQTKCCTGCTLCEPYVRLTLETGRTEFAVMTPAEVEAVLARGVSTGSGRERPQPVAQPTRQTGLSA